MYFATISRHYAAAIFYARCLLLLLDAADARGYFASDAAALRY